MEKALGMVEQDKQHTEQNRITNVEYSTNAQLWHVCPTIGNILLAAVKIFVKWMNL